MISKPKQRVEPFYFSHYISLSTQEYLNEAFVMCTKEVITVYDQLTEEAGGYKYSNDKWTLKQLLNHLIDTERILATRALRFSRKDTSLLPGFDENNFALNDNSHHLSVQDLLEEYKAVREATRLFYQNINETCLDFMGNANGTEISVRELGWIIVGHDLHHLKIIREKYLPFL
ncbi:MAG: DinB family protein [Lishizhenia sp.]